MKIAIHDFPGSFSDAWIDYCNTHDIQYKIVDCYSSDIIRRLQECDGLLWHWVQTDYKSMIFAKQFTIAIKKMGIKCFPDIDTAWHFDDKVGQKYLLEAINAPLVPTHVFYSKKDAIEWAESTEYPKVFKLRGGAGSVNVSLVRDKQRAKRLINKAFSREYQFRNSERIRTFHNTYRRGKNVR
jgi:carbamoylphosphate synthase large subunit